MSQTLSPCPEIVPDARRTPWLVFLLLWGCLFLADPLKFDFSNSDFLRVDAEQEDDNLERVERNIQQNEAGSVGRQIGLVVLALFGVWQLSRSSSRRLRIAAPLGEVILVFLGWCCLTILWSEFPVVTLRKLVALGCLCLGAVGLARACSLRQLVHFTLLCGGLLLVLGIPSEIVLGNFRVFHPSYRFSGLTWPAFAAWTLSLLILAVLALRHSSPHPRFLDLLAGVAVVVFLLTRTRASLGGLIVALLFHAAVTWPARRWVTAVLLAGCSAAAVGLAASVLGGDLVAATIDLVNLGRTETAGDVSGRAGLWNDLMPYLESQPLGGYGYESFWTPAHLLAVGQSNWGAPDAHNSFINLTLGAGVIGTGLLVLILLFGLHRAWALYRKSSNRDYLFICETLIVLVFNAGFVSTVLAPAVYSFAGMVLLAHLGFAEGPAPEEPTVTSGALP